MIRASSNLAKNIVTCLRVSIEGDIGHFAKSCRVGICDTRGLLPVRYVPDQAYTATAGPVVNIAVVPNLFELIGVIEVDMQRRASYACDIWLRCWIIHGRSCICAC